VENEHLKGEKETQFVVTNKHFETLRNFVSLIETINEKSTLLFDADGIHMSVMDPTHVFVIQGFLKNNILDTFDVKESTKITMRVNDFHKFLSRLDKDEERQ
jgi:hypothetical protein